MFQNKSILIVLLSLFLFGCNIEKNKKDLEDFLLEVNSKSIEKQLLAPTMPEYRLEKYRGKEIRDPFLPVVNTNIEVKKVYSGPKPDTDRVREKLETIPLDAIELVGFIKEEGHFWSIVKDPEKILHRVKIGHYMGQNYGKIIQTNETSLKLKELIPDGEGWQERFAELILINERDYQ